MHAGTNDSTRSINTLKTVKKKTEVKPNTRLIFVQLNTGKTHKRYFKKRYPMLMVVWRITVPRKKFDFIDYHNITEDHLEAKNLLLKKIVIHWSICDCVSEVYLAVTVT